MAIAIERASLTPNGTNGSTTAETLQDPLHLPRRLPLWFTIRERLKKGWLLVVTRNDGKFSVREGIAYVVLAAALAFGGASYWKSQDQHDEIIRLRTIVEIQDKTNADILSKVDQARNFATIADKNAARLEGKFDQFALTYSIKNVGRSNGGVAQ